MSQASSFYNDMDVNGMKGREPSDDLFFRMSPDLFCVIGNDGRFLRLNPAWEGALGYSLEEMTGRHYTDFVHPDDVQASRNEVVKVEEEGETLHFLNRYRRRDGTYRWLQWRARAVGDSKELYAVARDITESRETNEKLVEQQSLLEAITSSARDAILMIDNHGNVTYWNEAATCLFGYSGEEIKGRNLHQILVPAQSMIAHQEAFPRFQQTGEGAAVGKTLELSALHKDGTEIPIELSLSSVHRAGAWHAIGILRDLRWRREAERREKENEKRFRSAFELPLLGFAITSPEKGWMEINGALEEMLGYSREELKNLSWADLTHPDDIAPDVEQFNRILAGEIDKYVIEKRFLRKNGEVAWTIMSAGCVRKPDGTADYFVASIQDITRRKIAEEAVKHERRLLRTLIDNLPDAIYVKDAEGRKVLANEADWKLIGSASEEEIIGKTDREIYGNEIGERGYQDDMDVLLRNQPVIGREEDFVDASGRTVWLRTTKLPIFNENGTVEGLVGIGHVITEQREASRLLAEQAEELRGLVATKDKFFSIIAHDLRGPLGSFAGLTRLMAEGLQNMSLARVQEISTQLSRSSERVFDMLENLLEWSRMQRGMIPFEPEMIRLDEWVSEVITAFREQAGVKDVALHVAVEPGLLLRADKRMVEATLRNLTSNALKFTQPGGSIRVIARRNDADSVLITVKDNGIGMDEEILSQLFRIDTQANRPGTDGEPSSGLGLLLCKEFVDRHGGTISVESTPGQGAAFTIALPQNRL